MTPVCLTALRKTMKGEAYRGGPETRGAKKTLGRRAVSALDRKRKELVDKSEGNREVHGPDKGSTRGTQVVDRSKVMPKCRDPP